MLLRPYGVMISGELQLGLEVELEGNKIISVRPHTGVPEPYILSTAFVNAHSHLEYRGMLDQIPEEKYPEYWEWIMRLVEIKFNEETPEYVREQTILAAKENKQSGIALIGETSDRPYSGEAMDQYGLGGIIFQEVLTIYGHKDLPNHIASIEANKQKNQKYFKGPINLSPHSPYTVDPETLGTFKNSKKLINIHVAETEREDEFFLGGKNEFNTFVDEFDFPLKPTGTRVFDYLESKGLVKENVQFVHCCALNESEIERMARAGVVVASCPRSNMRLKCPDTKIREMLDHGIKVGLGLDSPASGGIIDMFEEMRAALEVANHRNRPITPEETWNMATTMGADSLGYSNWDIKEGASPSLIKLNYADAKCTEDILMNGSAKIVEWINEKITSNC